MRITVLGASGGCGQWVTQLASERGHEVTAVVRDSSGYQAPEGVRVVRGAVTEKAFVCSLDLDDAVVISCVGQRRASLFPWSKLLSPPDLVQTVASHLVDASPPRVVWISAGGVGPSRAQLSGPIRAVVNAGKVAIGYADLEEAESRLAAAAFPSFAVRPVTLTWGTGEQRVGSVESYGSFSTIHRRSVASWMLDNVDGRVEHDHPAILLGQV